MYNLKLLIQSRRVAVYFAAILLLVFSSCGNSGQMKMSIIDVDGWRAECPVVFTIDTIRCTGDYSLNLSLRTSSTFAFPYQQVDLLIQQMWNDSSVIRQDTLHCTLAKTDGEIMARGVSAYAYDISIDTLSLHAGDYGIISIKHLMRRSPLPGICNVGYSLLSLPQSSGRSL